MGTHPIFESDFDCLTGQTRFVLTNSLKCVTSLPIFSLNSVATKPQMSDAVKAILSSVGVDADEEKLSKVISELSGKNIDDVLAEGKEKLASVPSGGGAAPAAAAGGAAAAEEAPKEEAKEESESEDDDMGFDLFG